MGEHLEKPSAKWLKAGTLCPGGGGDPKWGLGAEGEGRD